MEQRPKDSINIDNLARRVGKYALVVAVAQRSRELREHQYRRGDRESASVIGRALHEIYDGRVKLIDEETEE